MVKTIVFLFFSALVESEARPLALEENEVNHDSSVSSRTGLPRNDGIPKKIGFTRAYQPNFLVEG